MLHIYYMWLYKTMCAYVDTVLRWFNLWPVRLPLHSFRCHADLSSQVSRLKHQQPACVCPSDHTLCRHPAMTQEIDGLNLWEAALFQGPLWVAEQLEHTSSTHTELHVVERVEADLKGHQQNNKYNILKACIPACRKAALIQHGRLTWLTGLFELLVFTVARILCFSQSQKTSIHSGAPDWPIRYLESGEKAMQTNSWTGVSPAVRTFLFLPCSCCRSNTVMEAFSPHSDTAR